MFGKGELEAEFEGVLAAALKKKYITGSMSSSLFENSSLMKPLAFCTQKQVETYLGELRLVEDLTEGATKVTEANPRKCKDGNPLA